MTSTRTRRQPKTVAWPEPKSRRGRRLQQAGQATALAAQPAGPLRQGWRFLLRKLALVLVIFGLIFLIKDASTKGDIWLNAEWTGSAVVLLAAAAWARWCGRRRDS